MARERSTTEDGRDDEPRPYTFIIDFYAPFTGFEEEVVVASGASEDDARAAASRMLGERHKASGLSADPLGEHNGDGEAHVVIALRGDVAHLVTAVENGHIIPIRA
ncbi:hypothetical protein ACGFJC_47075 [Nonomuraea fuscirosea]|uniref:hypothetical protein n=1 Tax=Nonomuraea fuscirosea TaxID=1291556 RepID=UPI0037165AA3